MAAAPSSRGDVRTAIVGVAAQLLHVHGPAAVTTRAVAEGAGVQAPTIYRLFGDKDGLLEAVAEHVLAAHVAAKATVAQTAAEEDTDPVADLRAGWRDQIEFGLAHPTVFGRLTDPARAPSSAAAQAGRQILAARVHRIARAGRLRVSEPRAVDLVHAAGTGTVMALLTTPPASRDPDLADAMLDAVLRQVLSDPAAAAHSGPRTATVTLRAVAPELEELTDAERRLLTEWLDRLLGSGGRAG